MARRIYTPNEPAFARVPFIFRRQRYARGAPFPADGVSIPERTKQRMWSAFRIDFGNASEGERRRAAALEQKRAYEAAETLATEAAEAARAETMAAVAPAAAQGKQRRRKRGR